jgi:hypothetical protein
MATSTFDGLWQLFGAAGTDYRGFFRPLADVALVTTGPAQASVTVLHTNDTSVVYRGTGLAYDGTLVVGSITGVELYNGAVTVARLSSTPDHPFLLTGGAAVHGGPALLDLLLSGNNLVEGAGTGAPGAFEVLAGGTGADP